MQALWPFMFGLLVGVGVGVFALVRWWGRSMRNPEFARDVLKAAYKNSHPHWLQISQTDARKVCPVCGWTDDQGKNSELDKDAPQVPLAESGVDAGRT